MTTASTVSSLTARQGVTLALRLARAALPRVPAESAAYASKQIAYAEQALEGREDLDKVEFRSEPEDAADAAVQIAYAAADAGYALLDGDEQGVAEAVADAVRWARLAGVEDAL